MTLGRRVYVPPGRRRPVTAPPEGLSTLSVLSGIPVDVLVRVWRLAAADGGPAPTVRRRFYAALRGDVAGFRSGSARPRIY